MLWKISIYLVCSLVRIGGIERFMDCKEQGSYKGAMETPQQNKVLKVFSKNGNTSKKKRKHLNFKY